MEDNCEDNSTKRRDYDDELLEFCLSALFGSQMPNTQCAGIESLNTASTNNELPDVISPVQSILETAKPNIMPSISTTQSLEISSNRVPTSTSNQLAGTPSTPTVPPTTKRNTSRKQKHLGLWKPTDDLMLIQSVLQTCDLQMVHRGVKFSCKFTLKEITQRWYALLYDPKISRPALSAMSNLRPEAIANIQSRALFSIAEEELLAAIQSDSQSTIETFQELLTQNPNIFHRQRTAETLMSHWQIMKEYSLLSDQSSALENQTPLSLMSSLEDRNLNILNNDPEVTTSTTKHIPTLGEREESLNDFKGLLKEETEPILEQNLSLTNKKGKKEIKVLENELPTARVQVLKMTDISSLQFEPQTLAMLRGRLVRYLMMFKEITLGRSSKHQQVDVDLRLEGPASKISRLQATIHLSEFGVFFITCIGKRRLYVDGKPLVAGCRSRLYHNSVVKISGLKFVFLINHQYKRLQKLFDEVEQRFKQLKAEHNQWEETWL